MDSVHILLAAQIFDRNEDQRRGRGYRRVNLNARKERSTAGWRAMIGQACLSSVFAWKGSRCLDLGASVRQAVDESRRKVPSHCSLQGCHIRQVFGGEKEFAVRK